MVVTRKPKEKCLHVGPSAMGRTRKLTELPTWVPLPLQNYMHLVRVALLGPKRWQHSKTMSGPQTTTAIQGDPLGK